MGTRWDDADVLDLAAAYENSVDARRPPTFLPTVGKGAA
jgi:amidase